MMINRELLKKAKANVTKLYISLEKKAYVPMTAEAMAAAQQAPPVDPVTAGQPVMPPTQAGAFMPPAPAGAPIPPELAGPGGAAPAPTVDPQMLLQLIQDPQIQQLLAQQGISLSPQGPVGPDGQIISPEAILQILEQTMGGMSAPAPVTPSNAAPMGPAAAPVGQEAEMPVTLNLQDLQTLFKQISGGSEDVEQEETTPEGNSSPRVTNKQLKAQLDELQEMVYMLMDALGVVPPVTETGAVPNGSMGPAEPEAIAEAAQPQTPAVPPTPPVDTAKMAFSKKDKLTKMIERLRAQ